MSDYVRNKQVLYPVTKELLEKLNCSDAYDLEDRFPAGSKFTTEGFIDYSGKGEFLTMKSFYGWCNNMNKEDISWVVGEAIHFAYEVGYLDCHRKLGYSRFDEIVEEVLGYLDNDSERNTLKKILNMEV